MTDLVLVEEAAADPAARGVRSRAPARTRDFVEGVEALAARRPPRFTGA